jgi:hypothetical protein
MLESKLNPKIREIEYGKRELQTLPMYPLSMADQFKVADLIANILQSLDTFSQGNASESQFFVAFVKEIEKNIELIITLVCDMELQEAKEVTNKMTNDQFLEFADIIWTVNYETSLKNGKSLIEKVKQHWKPIQTEPIPEVPSMRLSPQSLNTIANTDLNTSLDSVIEREDLPSDKLESYMNAVKNEKTES